MTMKNSEREIDEDQNQDSTTFTTSFMSRMPKKYCELEIIKKTLELEDDADNIVSWLEIDSSPINEYNIEGLLDMISLTLFPNGSMKHMQPRLREVKIHELVLYLIRFHGQRFRRHPQFYYFI